MVRISNETIARLRELSSESVAEKLGIKVSRHMALCPMHEDHHPSLSFYGSKREKWFCFVCNNGGDAIDLVTENTSSNFVEACHWLCQEFSITSERSIPSKLNRKTVKIKRKEKLANEDALFSIEVAQWILDNNSLTAQGQDFLFAKRHLNPEIVKRLNIVSVDSPNPMVEKLSQVFILKDLLDSGFIKNNNGKLFFRMFTPCLLFPYYDQQGCLIGMQSRYLGASNSIPRFQFISSQRARLYNLPILKTLMPGDELYISEGISDCLALLSSGRKAVAIPSATILPQYDLFDLKDYNLHMYPDRDDAGRNAFYNLRSFFINHYTLIKEELLPVSVKDFGEYYILQHG